MYRKLLLLIVGLVAATLFAPLASADGFTAFNNNCAGGATDLCGYTVMYSINPAGGSNFTVSYTITNTTGAHPGNFALFQVTAFSGAVTIVSQPNNGTAFASNGNNGGNCTGATQGSICFTPTSPVPLTSAGASFSTTFTVSDTSLLTGTDSWNWKTLVQGSNGNIVATSATATPTQGQFPPVPEPASMLLLGTGLLGVGGLARFRHKK